jgi:HK97 gp10 family phage protein
MFGKFDGIMKIQDLLAEKIKQADPERVLAAQAAAAEMLKAKLAMLPNPRSRNNKSGHMLEAFVYEQDRAKVETVFGWGKFYGRFVESGHRAGGWAKKRMPQSSSIAARPHLRSTFESNKDELIRVMIDALGG